MSKTFYEVLEVLETASPEALKGAHRSLVQKWHPDRAGGNSAQATEITAALNHALGVLIDPVSRRRYDAQLAAERAARRPSPPPSPSPRPAPTPAPAQEQRPPPSRAEAARTPGRRIRIPATFYWVAMWLLCGAVLVAKRLDWVNGSWAFVMLGLCGAVMLIVKSSRQAAPSGRTVAWTGILLAVLVLVGHAVPLSMGPAAPVAASAPMAPVTKAPPAKPTPAPPKHETVPKKAPVAAPVPKTKVAPVTTDPAPEPRASARVDSDAAVQIEQPDYPRAAWLDGRQGTAVVRVTVAADGTTSSSLARSSGQPDLDAAALRARLTVYSVGWRNGRRASTQVDVPVTFRGGGR